MNATMLGRWLTTVAFGMVVPLTAQAGPIEPNAGTWRTWVISWGQPVSRATTAQRG